MSHTWAQIPELPLPAAQEGADPAQNTHPTLPKISGTDLPKQGCGRAPSEQDFAAAPKMLSPGASPSDAIQLDNVSYNKFSGCPGPVLSGMQYLGC